MAGTPGAFAFGFRLVAWDGTGLDAADTPANAAAFGVTQGGKPQLRLVALTECGTHAIIDAAFDGVERATEHRLARRLLPAPANATSKAFWSIVSCAYRATTCSAPHLPADGSNVDFGRTRSPLISPVSNSDPVTSHP